MHALPAATAVQVRFDSEVPRRLRVDVPLRLKTAELFPADPRISSESGALASATARESPMAPTSFA